MIKFPLKQEILLMLEKNIFLVGTIIFAGQDSLTVIDVKQRFHTDDENSDSFISERMIIDRHKVSGFSLIKERSRFSKVFKEKHLVNIIEFKKRG